MNWCAGTKAGQIQCTMSEVCLIQNEKILESTSKLDKYIAPRIADMAQLEAQVISVYYIREHLLLTNLANVS